MTLQSDTLAKHETASEAYNDYIQYLWIFEEAGAERDNSAGENAADNPSGSSRAAIPLTRQITPAPSNALKSKIYKQVSSIQENKERKRL